jgi:hypothetical protein
MSPGFKKSINVVMFPNTSQNPESVHNAIKVSGIAFY